MELNLNERKVSGGNKLSYGIYEDVIIAEIKENDDSTGLVVLFTSEDGEHTEKMSMSEKARGYTSAKLFELGIAAGAKEEKLIAAKTITQYAKLVEGEHIRLKLKGREIEISDKDTGEKKRIMISELGFNGFAEPVGGTTLKFKENQRGSKGDIRYLDLPAGVNVASAEAKTGDELPF